MDPWVIAKFCPATSTGPIGGVLRVVHMLCTKSDVLFNPKDAGLIWKLLLQLTTQGTLFGLVHSCMALVTIWDKYGPSRKLDLLKGAP